MQTEEQARKPVDCLDTMHPPPQQFVIISKAYSDGVSLWKDGPQITKEFGSESILESGRTYRTAASFVPKLVPKHFVTTLTVADELTYYECIAFERRTVMKEFSETTNMFIPKDVLTSYCSSLLFEPDGTKKYYTAGIELVPGQKFVVTEELHHVANKDVIECGEKSVVNGDINDCQQLINGET